MVTSKNMRCCVCRSYSVNKINEKLFKCDNCGQQYPQKHINYNCIDCDKLWRIDKDRRSKGFYFLRDMDYICVYAHFDKRCPDCANKLIVKRKEGLHPLLFE